MSVEPVRDLLCCPLTHESLNWADEDRLQALNREIAAGAVKHLEGSTVERPLQRALINAGGTLAYRWERGIFALLPDLAIPLTAEVASGYKPRAEKKAAQAFFNDYGWQKSGDLFKDTERFEDVRPVSAEYIHRCHLRVGHQLPGSGRYLLDAASGPVQFPEYVAYSDHFERRVCVDLSVAALCAAQERLGEKAIYILGDITRLPIRDGACDAAVSLHTIYHVPPDEQGTAFREVRRAVKSEGPAVVVYNWGHHCLTMDLMMLPFKILKWPNQVFRRLIKGKKKKDTQGGLIFLPHSPAWVREQLADLQPEWLVWRSVSVPWLRKWIHSWLLGRHLLRLVFAIENFFPHLLGRFGQYPLILLKSPRGLPAHPSATVPADGASKPPEA